MKALGALVWIVSLGSPALAAGGWDDMPAPFLILTLLWIVLLVGLPCVGLGFFLQGVMRLRNALLLLAFGLLVFVGFGVVDRGFARALELAPAFAVLLLFFAALFGLGWAAGIWGANRQARRRQLA